MYVVSDPEWGGDLMSSYERLAGNDDFRGASCILCIVFEWFFLCEKPH